VAARKIRVTELMHRKLWTFHASQDRCLHFKSAVTVRKLLFHYSLITTVHHETGFTVFNLKTYDVLVSISVSKILLVRTHKQNKEWQTENEVKKDEFVGKVEVK
jgi:hypothetical protein